jgi:endonuclease/exonuclease/phosphatase (EEP) superfamily protein YafD
VYVATVGGWSLAGYTRLARWWPYQLVDVFRDWTIAGLTVALGLLAVADQRWMALVAGAVWCAGVRPRRLANRCRGRRVSQGTRLRVLTCNLLWKNREAEAVCQVIAREQPDVIVLQELGAPMAARLAAGLGESYPYQALHTDRTWMGMGVLSRIPIGQSIMRVAEYTIGCLQEVVLEAGGRPVTLLNVHPVAPALRVARVGPVTFPIWFDPSLPGRLLRLVLQRAAEIEGALLVVGDCNVSAGQPWHRAMLARLHDAHLDAGGIFGNTFPSEWLPLVRIDYVFHDAAWAAWRTWTGRLRGSDHRFVAADLELLVSSDARLM